MKLISDHRCIIGEGPIWNEKENRLYYTNGYGNEICMLDIYTGELTVRPVENGCAAFCFDTEGRLIVSRYNGVFYLNDDNTFEALYDTSKYSISRGNDMKTGPDGCIYVGTLSEKKVGASDSLNGCLYRIDKEGNVDILLENIDVSNGLDWSADGKKFYHTDSATKIIKEYDFDMDTGKITYTGRSLYVEGVDGFCIDENDLLYAAGWGKSMISVVDIRTMTVTNKIPVPAKIPASCGFCGKDMEYLAVVTACYGIPESDQKEDGFTYIHQTGTKGKKPFLYGGNYNK